MELAGHDARADIRGQPPSSYPVDIFATPFSLIGWDLRPRIVQALGELRVNRMRQHQPLRLRGSRGLLARFVQKVVNIDVNTEFCGSGHSSYSRVLVLEIALRPDSMQAGFHLDRCVNSVA